MGSNRPGPASRNSALPWVLPLLIPVLLASALARVLVLRAGQATEQVGLALAPDSATVSVGTTADFTLQVTPNQLAPVGVQAKIRFDASVLQVVDADPNRAGVQVTPITDVLDSRAANEVTVTNGVGTISYSYFTTTPGVVPVDHPFNIASIRFKVLAGASQPTQVSFVVGTLADTVVTDARGQDILGNTFGARVIVPVAKPSLHQGIDADDKVAVVEVDLDDTPAVDSSLVSFQATVVYDSACIKVLDGRSGLPGFQLQRLEPNAVRISSNSPGGVQLPPRGNLARLAVQLTGGMAQPCELRLQNVELRTSSADVVIGVGADPQLSLLRGDATGDGRVDARDARRIARVEAGLARPGEGPEDLLAVNAASVAHDSNRGDVVDRNDTLGILEREVGNYDR